VKAAFGLAPTGRQTPLAAKAGWLVVQRGRALDGEGSDLVTAYCLLALNRLRVDL